MAGSLLATAAMANPPLPREPTDQLDVNPRGGVLELSWSDAEERLRGSIRPAVPREGEPLVVDLRVDSFEGAAFDGPLILTLREAGARHGRSLTVAPREHHWEATFTPEHDGPHLLDVSFRSTRHKSLHAAFPVGGSLVPRMLGWGVLGLGFLVLLGYSVRGLLKGARPEERPLPSSAEAPPTIEPPVAPTSPAPGSEALAAHPAEVATAPAPTSTAEVGNEPPADP